MMPSTPKAFTSVTSGSVTTPIVYIGAGALASGTATIAPVYPAGVRQGDFCLMVLEAGGESAITTVPAGWTEIDAGRKDVATTAGSLLRVFYQFFPLAYAYNGTGTADTTTQVNGAAVADHGDHTAAAILAWRNVNATTPFDVSSTWTSSASAVTTLTPAAITTVTDRCKIVIVASRPNDAATADFGTIKAGNLSSTAERLDTGTTQGHGGGLYVMDAQLATAGGIGTVSIAKTASTTYVTRTIALRPA